MVKLPFRAAACALLFATAPIGAEEILSVRVSVALETIPAPYLEGRSSTDRETAERRALEEASLVLSGMIYGWDFEYDIGEKARNIAERFTIADRGRIEFGDPRLTVTDASVEDAKLLVWAEYRADEAQTRRLAYWKSGDVRPVQGTGFGPLAYDLEGKRAALEEAARAAIRALLRGSERNRPKEARGEAALAAAPRYWVDAGRLVASARFRVIVREIVPFAVY